VIKFINVSKSYVNSKGQRQQVLSNINLTVNSGEIFGIIGPSGAGKSTLIRLVNKLESTDNGEVWVDNKLINNLTGRQLKLARQDIGMIFQHFNLLESYTVYDNILFPLKINKPSGAEHRLEILKHLDTILELTELKYLINKYPSQLSGGQKQRVAIARSLITNPQVLLCDECTSSLDPQTTSKILELLKKINKELNITILLITHEMDVIKSICDKVAVISNGSIIDQGSVLDLYFNSEHEVTHSILLKSLINKLPKQIKDDIELNLSASAETYPIIELKFSEQSTSEPIIAQTILKYKTNFNILQGEIETIQDKIIGRLVLQLEADSQTFAAIVEDLKQNQVKTEIIAYVSRIY
jgi:D-methionine transport system ATP-binding protein